MKPTYLGGFALFAALHALTACATPTDVTPPPCHERDTVSAPVSLQRVFDPQDCALSSLDDVPFTGTDAGGTFRYHAFVVAVPPLTTIGFEWGGKQLSGLGVRIYDADGGVLNLNAIGAVVHNTGFSDTTTIQVLVTETAGRMHGEFTLEVTSRPFTGPLEGRYHLRTIGGEPLPVTVFSTSNFIAILSSVIELRADFTFEQVESRRYSSSYQPTTESTTTRSGTYARSGNALILTMPATSTVTKAALQDANTMVVVGTRRQDLVDYIYVANDPFGPP